MKEIKFLCEKGIKSTLNEIPGSSTMEVRAMKILAVYKGEQETADIKVKKLQEAFQTTETIRMRPFERMMFGTGLQVMLPEGLEYQIRPLDECALKKGLLVANSPGVINSNYRGEITVILYNSSPHLISVEKGEKIAQLVLVEVTDWDDVQKIEITKTEFEKETN